MKGIDAPLGSVATDDGRYYEWKGERFISVTNVLQHTISKPVLVPWAAKLVAEFGKANPGLDIKEWKKQPTLVKDKASERGTNIHAWCEQFFLNPAAAVAAIPHEYSKECIGFIKAVERFQIVPIAAEATVYSRAHGHAGTNDFFGTILGQPAGADIKTGKNVYPEYALQIAAYSNAEFVGLPDGSEAPIPLTAKSYVIHVDHGTTRLIPLRSSPKEFEAFICAVGLARWLVEESKHVIGKEVK